MAKSKIVFVCDECGYESAKWLGKCPSCGRWNTLKEFKDETSDLKAHFSKAIKDSSFDKGKLVNLKDVKESYSARLDTGIGELNRVLGGGIVPGSVVLVGGEPGIGKSTLFLQMADNLSQDENVIYISGEESADQVAMRFKRLGLSSGLKFVAENKLETILSIIETEKPKTVIIDSIQTIYNTEIDSIAGSVSQIRECASFLARVAKATNTSVFIIGHVTKEGNIAGPRVLEHLVDTVLYFEGENQSAFRILRAVKNRFGSTNEIGVFDMTEQGMEEVSNPSAIMLSGHLNNMSGSSIYCSIEGTRPVLLEVEALVSESSFGNARRMTSGVDYNRVNLIIAVLEKRIGLKMYNQDVYVNVGGGIRTADPAIDLSIAASIVSSLRNKVIIQDTVLFGEIGLTGEIRHISQGEKRIAEAKRMGMTRVILPASNVPKTDYGIEIIGVRTLFDALGYLF